MLSSVMLSNFSMLNFEGVSRCVILRSFAYFQKLALQVKANLENVTNLASSGEDFRWYMKVSWCRFYGVVTLFQSYFSCIHWSGWLFCFRQVKCVNCGEETPNHVYVCEQVGNSPVIGFVPRQKKISVPGNGDCWIKMSHCHHSW